MVCSAPPSFLLPSPYPCYLPFDGSQPRTCGQGNHGNFSHFGDSEYAFDFDMPIGTPLIAATEGVVVETKDDSDVVGPDVSFANSGNYVLVQHADLSLAQYVHLRKDGAAAKEGQYVKIGDLIGYSGNTGWSAGPHLHFVIVLRAMKQTSVPSAFIARNTGRLFLPQMKERIGFDGPVGSKPTEPSQPYPQPLFTVPPSDRPPSPVSPRRPSLPPPSQQEDSPPSSPQHEDAHSPYDSPRHNSEPSSPVQESSPPHSPRTDSSPPSSPQLYYSAPSSPPDDSPPGSPSQADLPLPTNYSALQPLPVELPVAPPQIPQRPQRLPALLPAPPVSRQSSGSAALTASQQPAGSRASVSDASAPASSQVPVNTVPLARQSSDAAVCHAVPQRPAYSLQQSRASMGAEMAPGPSSGTGAPIPAVRPLPPAPVANATTQSMRGSKGATVVPAPSVTAPRPGYYTPLAVSSSSRPLPNPTTSLATPRESTSQSRTAFASTPAAPPSMPSRPSYSRTPPPVVAVLPQAPATVTTPAELSPTLPPRKSSVAVVPMEYAPPVPARPPKSPQDPACRSQGQAPPVPARRNTSTALQVDSVAPPVPHRAHSRQSSYTPAAPSMYPADLTPPSYYGHHPYVAQQTPPHNPYQLSHQ